MVEVVQTFAHRRIEVVKGYEVRDAPDQPVYDFSPDKAFQPEYVEIRWRRSGDGEYEMVSIQVVGRRRRKNGELGAQTAEITWYREASIAKSAAPATAEWLVPLVQAARVDPEDVAP